MINKLIFILAAILAPVFLFSQRKIFAEEVTAHDAFRLGDLTVNEISTSSDFSLATDSQLATRLAIKNALGDLADENSLVYVLSSISDTSTIVSPNIGDIGYVNPNQMVIRENQQWLVFGFSGDWGDLTNVPPDILDGDQVDDADNSATNEVISNMYLNETNLIIEESASAYAVDLSPILPIDTFNFRTDFKSSVLTSYSCDLHLYQFFEGPGEQIRIDSIQVDGITISNGSFIFDYGDPCSSLTPSQYLQQEFESAGFSYLQTHYYDDCTQSDYTEYEMDFTVSSDIPFNTVTVFVYDTDGYNSYNSSSTAEANTGLITFLNSRPDIVDVSTDIAGAAENYSNDTLAITLQDFFTQREQFKIIIEHRLGVDTLQMVYEPNENEIFEYSKYDQFLFQSIPSVLEGKGIVYVSKAVGNNSTGKAGNFLFPFRDPWAARDYAETQNINTIYILDGNYKSRFGSDIYGYDFFGNGDHYNYSLIRDGLTYIAAPGVSFEVDESNLSFSSALFYDTTGVTCSFLGSADFYIDDDILGFFTSENTDFTLEANSIHSRRTSKYAFAICANCGQQNTGIGSLNIKANNVEVINSKFMAMWGNSTYTLSDANISWNFNNLVLKGGALFGNDPIYIYDSDIIINVDNLSIEQTGVESRVFDFFRAGFRNSNLIVSINNTKCDVDYSLIYFRSSGQSSGSKSFFNLGNVVGKLRLVSYLAGTQMSTGLDEEVYINAQNWYYTGTVESFFKVPAAMTSNWAFNIKGNYYSETLPIFDIQDNNFNCSISGNFETGGAVEVIKYDNASASHDLTITNSLLVNTSGTLMNVVGAGTLNVVSGSTILSNSIVLTNVTVSTLTKLE